MQVRLGFSIATAVATDILIVDEVLAVGDLNFQRKCMARMAQLIEDRRHTVVIVGHNIRQMERVCKRLVLLDHGRVVTDGEPSALANLYYERDERRRLAEAAGAKISAVTTSGELHVMALEMVAPDTGREVDAIEMHHALRFRLHVRVVQPVFAADVSIGFHTVDLLHVATFNTAALAERVDLRPGDHVIKCEVSDVPLMPGIYGVRVGVNDRNARVTWYQENVRTLMVGAGLRSRARMALQCIVDLPVSWRVSRTLASAGSAAFGSERRDGVAA